MDVVFSVLFMSNLVKMEGLGPFFLAILIVGQLTYCLAILWYGPKNKYATMKVVKQMMVDSRDQFAFEPPPQTGELYLNDNFPVTKGGAGRTPKFKDLQADEDGRQAFRAGLTSYGPKFTTIWVYADAKNMKNVCERKHGIPFLRLAHFGFMAQPTPRDLAGVLNANAAYTFATGIMQMALGAYMAVLSGWPLPLENLLPLCVSGVSLILSIFNIALDFSQMLSEIDYEQKLADNLESDSAAALASEKKALQEARDKKICTAKTEFEESQKTVFLKEKMTAAIADADREYDIDLRTLNTNNVRRLEAELVNHRRRMQQIKKARTGRMPEAEVVQDPFNAEEYEKLKTRWQGIIDAKKQVYEARIDELDAKEDNYTSELLRISNDRDKELVILKTKMDEELAGFGRSPETGEAGEP